MRARAFRGGKRTGRRNRLAYLNLFVIRACHSLKIYTPAYLLLLHKSVAIRAVLGKQRRFFFDGSQMCWHLSFLQGRRGSIEMVMYCLIKMMSHDRQCEMRRTRDSNLYPFQRTYHRLLWSDRVNQAFASSRLQEVCACVLSFGMFRSVAELFFLFATRFNISPIPSPKYTSTRVEQ